MGANIAAMSDITMRGKVSEWGQGAILYDFLRVPGGAEKVALQLAQSLPDCDLCVSSATNGSRWREYVNPDRLKDLDIRGDWPPWLALKCLRGFRSKTEFLNDYDWALFSGSYAPVAVVNHPAGRNLYYCHTVPRFIYDLKRFYLESLPPWQRPALSALISYVRPLYETAIGRMDRVLANSENIARRLKIYLGIDSTVVYPPCDIERFHWQEDEGYYLSTARLESYKRVELIIDAFLKMPDRKLVVASGGSERAKLIERANGASNIHFTDWCGEAALQRLIARSIATIYLARDEDFGLSPVESMACGKPVIGVREGGLMETVIDRMTGLFVPADPTVDHLIDAVLRMSPKRARSMRDDCLQRARTFSSRRFIERMHDEIDATVSAA